MIQSLFELAAATLMLASAPHMPQASPMNGGRHEAPLKPAGAAMPAAAPTRVILLGTAAGPGGSAERAGIASLLVVAGKTYLIDAGAGVDRQLARAGFPERNVNTIFLTHLHDDHTAGLPGLLTFAYTLRTKGVLVLGPPNTDRLMQGVLSYMAPNAAIRAQEQQSQAPETLLKAKVIAEGKVFADGTVSVTAVRNTHYHFAMPSSTSGDASYSYRFETPDKVVVFTGDTGPSEAVEKLAKGADILVSEMITSADMANVPPDIATHMVRDHLSPSQVGMLAAKAGVGTLVLSHIRNVSEKDVAIIQSYFHGRIVVGRDLDGI